MIRNILIVSLLGSFLTAETQEITTIPVYNSAYYLIKGRDTFLLQKGRVIDTLTSNFKIAGTLVDGQVRGRLIEIVRNDGSIDTLKNIELEFTDQQFVNLFSDPKQDNLYMVETVTQPIRKRREIQLQTTLGNVYFSFEYTSQEDFDSLATAILKDILKLIEPDKISFYKKNVFLTSR